MSGVAFVSETENVPVVPLPDLGRTTINLSALTYSDRTLRLVAEAVREFHAEDLAPLGYIAQNLDGRRLEYTMDIRVEGSSLAKRVGAYLFNTWKIKLSREDSMRIGEIAAEAKGFTIDADLTSRLDWDAGDYGDRGSCFFGDRTRVRTQTMPRLHASALRFWRNGNGIGRCFVLPVPRRLTGNDFNAYIMCNHYGVHITPQRCAATLVYLMNRNVEGEWEEAKVTVTQGVGIDFYCNPSQPYLIFPKGMPALANVTLEHGDLDNAMALPQWALDAQRAYDERNDDDDDYEDYYNEDDDEGG